MAIASRQLCRVSAEAFNDILTGVAYMYYIECVLTCIISCAARGQETAVCKQFCITGSVLNNVQTVWMYHDIMIFLKTFFCAGKIYVCTDDS